LTLIFKINILKSGSRNSRKKEVKENGSWIIFIFLMAVPAMVMALAGKVASIQNPVLRISLGTLLLIVLALWLLFLWIENERPHLRDHKEEDEQN